MSAVENTAKKPRKSALVDDEFVALAECARRAGVTLRAVQVYADKHGLLVTRKGSPGVYWRQFVTHRSGNPDVELSAGNYAGAVLGETPPDPDASGQAPPIQGTAYRDARTRLEIAKAETAELELAELRAALVRVDAVEAQLLSVAQQLRDELLRPDLTQVEKLHAAASGTVAEFGKALEDFHRARLEATAKRLTAALRIVKAGIE